MITVLLADDQALVRAGFRALLDSQDDLSVIGEAGTGAEDASGTGSGLLGMAERAAALGGQLDAGPRPGGGFRVAARLPVRARVPA